MSDITITIDDILYELTWQHHPNTLYIFNGKIMWEAPIFNKKIDWKRYCCVMIKSNAEYLPQDKYLSGKIKDAIDKYHNLLSFI